MIIIQDGFIPYAECLSLVSKIMATTLTPVNRPERQPEALDMGEAYTYLVGNRNSADNALGAGMADAIYNRVLEYTRRNNPDVIASPYYPSSMTIKIFEPGHSQGWHYDTNPVTALLYLTQCDGGETEFVDGTLIAPQPGRLAIFNGRDYLHQARPVIDGAKISLPINLYLRNDTYRPKAVDHVVYG